MIDNEKLARWQGWVDWNDGTYYNSIKDEVISKYGLDYLNDDAAAMSLLDTLVEKGFEYSMFGSIRKTDVRIFSDDVGICISIKPTRREAVVAAVLELIGKEDV